MYVCTVGEWLDGWTDGWMDEQMDGWIGYVCVCSSMNLVMHTFT